MSVGSQPRRGVGAPRRRASVEVETIGFRPGRRVLTPVEWTAIFIGTNVAVSLIDNLMTDVYVAAKRMLAERRRGAQADGKAGRQLGFVIYGPNGEELRRWTTVELDEQPLDDNQDTCPPRRRQLK